MALCVTYGMSLDVCMVPGVVSLSDAYVRMCVCVCKSWKKESRHRYIEI